MTSTRSRRRNIRMILSESLQQIDEVRQAAGGRAVSVDAVVSCAFGSPYDDALGVDELATLAGRAAPVAGPPTSA